MSEVAKVVETHLSTVMFLDDRVVKVKKPIRTGFVDFTTVAARQCACQREVDLNRRLTPDVYLGVADISMSGQVVEHAVVMRRLPEHRRLSARLEQPDVVDDLRSVARLMASFHEGAERSETINTASGHDALAGLWDAGLTQIEPYVGRILDPDVVGRTGLLVREYLAGRRSMLDARVAKGRACDGHGDLQAEDIFMMDDGPRILDCLEFDDSLRYGDVLADLAFLAMDLERLGHPRLGEHFLHLYRQDSADYWPQSLAHFHIAYRAHVRCKVNCIRHDQGDPEAAHAARALQDQALSHLEDGRVQIVMVGGSPGTGKSTVAAEIGDHLGAVVLSSDDIRDDLVPRRPDHDPHEPDGVHQGRYRRELVESVYREMLREAELLTAEGHSVVLDASWLQAAMRRLVRDLAQRVAGNLSEIRCVCPADLATSRIRRRAAAGHTSSEATADVAAALRREAEPWMEAFEIRTDRRPRDAVDEAMRHVTQDSVGNPRSRASTSEQSG